MIIYPEILRKILKQRHPPLGCPEDVGYGVGDFFKNFDTIGGFHESKDGTHVTCRRWHYLSNNEIVHPSCEHCPVANTDLIEMTKYRRLIGLAP